jgi:hypothetical protein
VAGDRLDGALGDVGPLGPPVAAIRVDGHGVGDDHLRHGLVVLDPVVTRAEVHGVHGGAARRHVRQVGADIAQRLDLQAEDAAVVLDGDLQVLGVGPAVAGRLMAFGA